MRSLTAETFTKTSNPGLLQRMRAGGYCSNYLYLDSTGTVYVDIARGDLAKISYCAYRLYQYSGVKTPRTKLANIDETVVLMVEWLFNHVGYTDLSNRILANGSGDALSEDEREALGRMMAVSVLIRDYDVLGVDDNNTCNVLYNDDAEAHEPVKIDVDYAFGTKDPISIRFIQERKIELNTTTVICFGALHDSIQTSFCRLLCDFRQRGGVSQFWQQLQRDVKDLGLEWIRIDSTTQLEGSASILEILYARCGALLSEYREEINNAMTPVCGPAP